MKKTTQLYQLKITLEDIKPAVWRRFVVPASIELPEFHLVIQCVMGWYNSHLHAFEIGGESYGDGSGEPSECCRSEDGVKLSSLLSVPKSWLRYTYDFGDDWDHKIVLEKILEPSADIKPYTCLKAVRACPPEDCGGRWGYENLLEVLADPKHPEYKGMAEWIDPEFDAEAVSLEDINSLLAANF